MSDRPLRGSRVLVTRPLDQALAWKGELESAGAEVVVYPTIRVVEPQSWEELDGALERLHGYDWLLFTSAAAVRFAAPRILASSGGRLPKVAAVGRQTAAALVHAGFPRPAVPPDERQDGMIQMFSAVAPGTCFLFPQAAGGREDLVAYLRARACTVDVVQASVTEPIAQLPPLPAFQVATFASPSALRAFVAAHGTAPLRSRPVVVIGQTTAAAAAEVAVAPLVAASPSIESIIAAIATARSSQTKGGP
jgi:uroporphyrinogen-III synthase